MIGSFLSSLLYFLLPTRILGALLEQDELTYYSNKTYFFAVVLFVWYLVIVSLSLNGFIEILLKFKARSQKEFIRGFLSEGVTILRPLKGIDPQMESCLESSFLQEYPTDKFELIFCIADPNDPCIPLVTKLCERYSHVNSRILIDSTPEHYGPNPKINNLAKGYSLANFDIIWVLDSNVKVLPGTLQRSVAALLNSTDNGRKTSRKVKLVHHIPLAIASSDDNSPSSYGAKCDEMFMLTSHAKFYVSLNKVSLRPCVNGKSNLYRKSDLDFAVSQMGEGFVPSHDGKSGILGNDAAFYSQHPGNGIKLFARYIGEDNMIGIALWDYCTSRTGMTGDVVVQPLGGINTVNDYCDRRIRWLRVRKYMVLVATLLEPTTESILSGLFGSFAISVLFLNQSFNIFVFILHMFIWFMIDCHQYKTLLAFTEKEPPKFSEFVKFWLFRELLALPIWVVAMFGHKIDWRGKPFKIRRDLSAEEL